jgi:signal transduction histidine kinase
MRHFRIYAFPVPAEKGPTRRVVLMIGDTTSHVQIEERLQQSEKMAAIGELSTYIAHEIRNPLFAIGGFANSLLRSASLDETARGKARIILEESKRLDGILKSILNFARPTDQAVGEIDTNSVAHQTVNLMGIGGDERRIELGLDLADSLPIVRGNAEMLKQCLINLVKNAQESMPDGGHIVVRTRLAGPNVLVQVQDDGPGIPADLHERVFSPFFSTKDKGAGLGLAMTRKIIEEMGGRVHLASRPGSGTTVSLTLRPALAVDADQGGKAEEDGHA